MSAKYIKGSGRSVPPGMWVRFADETYMSGEITVTVHPTDGVDWRMHGSKLDVAGREQLDEGAYWRPPILPEEVDGPNDQNE
jgi:hypothetical protein